ncbi:13903_t:CDS:2 [Dentiscutata erythropus]|uniref:13903_t:CDS:1 n=1 Tax=Dentiscutata erythropus TaxID=1348616 RepID=A0A9N9IFM2_9GLOM|nr:13903_t:CDS:2 [Dentiscutata erythropus]
MKCEKCQINKLSEEFPFGTISSKCEHVTSWCLKCLVNYLKETQQHQCPTCEAKLTEQEFNDYCSLWDNANFKIDLESFSQERTELPIQDNTNSEIFYVVRLNGEKFELRLSEINTIQKLKHRLMNYTKIDIDRQMLIHKNVDYGANNTLASYGIRANSHIQLIVVLCSITKQEAIKNLALDLYWGYPDSGIDFLDGTCLIYKGDNLWKTYDWSHLSYTEIPYIKHSGDIMNNENATGHQKITAKLENLPKDVTQLYLVLSSYSFPSLGHFRNPSFKLYDEERPDKQLCDYNIYRARESQAIIVCLINRSHGNWNVIEVCRPSQGNTNNYGPIMETIKDIRSKLKRRFDWLNLDF